MLTDNFMFKLFSLSPTLATTRKLDRVNFCRDFWDCSQGREKKLANSRLAPPNKTIPETIAARISAPVPFSYLSGECHPVWVHERKSGNELWSLIVNYKTSLFENSLAITNVASLRSR